MRRKILKPSWLSRPLVSGKGYEKVIHILDELDLKTVCQEALCPNICECFGRGVATFMLLGNVCTRDCRYCNVSKGKPDDADDGEPARIAQAVKSLGLKHAVLTSVTRDDIADHGASHFCRTVKKIKESKGCRVEVLVPDFSGDITALKKVMACGIDVLNHNIEVVKGLFSKMRPKGNYDISMALLRNAKAIAEEQGNRILIKSGMMLGLGEDELQIEETLKELKAAGVDFVTLGQYLQPSKEQAPVHKYYSPAEFESWKNYAKDLGFKHVESGVFVRSSYNADKISAEKAP